MRDESQSGKINAKDVELFRNESVHEFYRLKAVSTSERERCRAFPERVGPRILSLESVDYFGTSEYFSENFDGEAINVLKI